MAESDDSEKTEDPTQKRLDDALEKGDVAKSQEVNTWFIMGTGALILSMFSSSIGSGLTPMFVNLLANADRIPTDGRGLLMVTQKLGLHVLAVVALPFVLLVIASFAGNLIQHRFVFTTQSLIPKFEKISPLAGAKRLFSKQSAANFIKGLIKISVVGAVMASLVWPERDRLDALVRTDIAAVLPITKMLALKLMGYVVAILAVVAAADFFFQYRTWYEKQKMSLHDIKEEFKQTDGDPHIKGKLRQLRQQRMRKRMMAAVPKASVIITNPTHYAVALQYDHGMTAPVCVAKGTDRIALKIREIAAQHSIPVVENVPLARALHAAVEIDQEVPPEHYKAVAEVIGYVMKLRRSFAS